MSIVGSEMSTFDLDNPIPLPGDTLRDEAANLLFTRYGQLWREVRVCGKKTDLYFVRNDFGKEVRIYVEAKDYGHKLHRHEVVQIWADYSGIIKNNMPAQLLIITRQGLSPDAQAYVQDEQSEMRHQTIWSLENEMLGLTDYIRSLTVLFEEDGLNSYYVAGRAREISYLPEGKRVVADKDMAIIEEIGEWLLKDDSTPIAILGGYGAGKTSLAKNLISKQAIAALGNPRIRRPIYIRLGAISRYSDLAGLLGGMFTHDFPVEGFNVHRFLDTNKKGRLFIVLDGFDEMKHAMTWADFRSTLTELNKLVEGRSKVLLLGRPSALITEDEHHYVLRGKKRFDGGWRQIPGWPNFCEFELQSFSAQERDDFIFNYLKYRNPSALEDDSNIDCLKQRAEEVTRLANMEPDVFGKPVHAKILTDLAADPKVDLTKFSAGVSRWQLYETFFTSLAEREVEKEARRGITEQHRLEFIREIAFWLWSVRGGVTSFYAHEIPDMLFEQLPHGDAPDIEAIKREYLSGSFLEKKSGDIYYFSHRSFAEFLVAERMVKKQPQATDQPVYSNILRDGVLTFLNETPYKNKIKEWKDTLAATKGILHLEYLSFLAQACGDLNALIDSLPRESALVPVLRVFNNEITFNREVGTRIIKAMRTHNNSVFFMLLSLLLIQGAATRAKAETYATSIAAAILDRLFEKATLEDAASSYVTVTEDYTDARSLAIGVIPCMEDGFGQRFLVFNGQKMLQLHSTGISGANLEVCAQPPVPLLSLSGIYKLPWSDVLKEMKPEIATMVRTYFQRTDNLKNVIVKGYIPNKKRRQKS